MDCWSKKLIDKISKLFNDGERENLQLKTHEACKISVGLLNIKMF